MLIGKGVIANRFVDYSLQSNCLVFAGGVNDSAIQDEALITNEEEAVKKALAEWEDSTFVYFSSCSILDSSVQDTQYVQHKKRMEALIQNSAKKFIIIRLPQVMGLSDNNSSLVNYLFNAINNQKPFELWQNVQKNLIDIDDVHQIVGELLKSKQHMNKVVNVASTQQTLVKDLVHEIESFLGTSSNYQAVDKGTSYDIDISDIKPILLKLDIGFNDGYIKASLNKYFAHHIAPPKLISVVVPTYNEEHGIEEFYHRTKAVLVGLAPRFKHEIIFVNDYSTDGTLQKLDLLAKMDKAVKVINFSRNFGNQIGITAGIDYSRGDVVVVIDDDLQDPPEIIRNLIASWDKGFKVVYGVRPKRQGVNPLFKILAKIYYRLIGSLSDTKIPNDTGDFRLIDRTVVNTLKEIREENRYYRGLVAWVGYPQIGVEYERDKRFAGESTFSFKKYVNFALNGLTSFTEKPLYFSSVVGLIITVVSFMLALFLVGYKILDPSVSIQGWTSIVVIILFFGGIQLLSIGILGIYISKIYREVKGRPLYIVENTNNVDQDKNEG
ncbi:glycosyltransferase family 2 protein [Gammaproteobacteria bacterium]|nr:glycosyltransferase family 2 protein [Gammaproteobacteria bacterium]